MENNSKKLFKKNLEQKNYLKEKRINCTYNEKGMLVDLTVALIKKISYKNKTLLS